MRTNASSLRFGAPGAGHLIWELASRVFRTASVSFNHLKEILASRPARRADNKVESRESGGRVTLVGAGPGDPELLTLKALRAIECADVILFDALVSDSILRLATSGTKLIAVGKRGGRPSCRQDDINEQMVDLARRGKHVVRLKAGDPAVFARAGEEISHLRAAGIEVGIVPGITAASAMAAAFGISLTHRNHAKSVRFVTGHSKNGGLPEDINWHAVADPSATTVFYMGAHLAAEIAERLMALGMPSDTPIGIAASLSRENQKIACCRLGELDCAITNFDRSEPLILGIGVVYRDNYNAVAHTSEDFANADIAA